MNDQMMLIVGCVFVVILITALVITFKKKEGFSEEFNESMKHVDIYVKDDIVDNFDGVNSFHLASNIQLALNSPVRFMFGNLGDHKFPSESGASTCDNLSIKVNDPKTNKTFFVNFKVEGDIRQYTNYIIPVALSGKSS